MGSGRGTEVGFVVGAAAEGGRVGRTVLGFLGGRGRSRVVSLRTGWSLLGKVLMLRGLHWYLMPSFCLLSLHPSLRQIDPIFKQFPCASLHFLSPLKSSHSAGTIQTDSYSCRLASDRPHFQASLQSAYFFPQRFYLITLFLVAQLYRGQFVVFGLDIDFSGS